MKKNTKQSIWREKNKDQTSCGGGRTPRFPLSLDISSLALSLFDPSRDHRDAIYRACSTEKGLYHENFFIFLFYFNDKNIVNILNLFIYVKNINIYYYLFFIVKKILLIRTKIINGVK